MSKFVTHNERETRNLGRHFAVRRLMNGGVVALFGDLGTGKTTFVKGVCEGLGVHQHVASPTFTIINEYKMAKGRLFHVDLYRIASAAELIEAGFEECFGDGDVCVIEWAERAGELLPDRRFEVHFAYGKIKSEREIGISDRVSVPS